MSDEPTLRNEIALVEDRLAERRRRTTEDFHEVRMRVRDTARRTANWIPLAAIVAVVAGGVILGRRHVPASIASARGAGIAGGLMALAGAALRLALSPQGRALWHALRPANKASRRSGY